MMEFGVFSSRNDLKGFDLGSFPCEVLCLWKHSVRWFSHDLHGSKSPFGALIMPSASAKRHRQACLYVQ